MSYSQIVDMKRGRAYAAERVPARLCQALVIRDAALQFVETFSQGDPETSPRWISRRGQTRAFSVSYRSPTPLAFMLSKSAPGLLGNLPWGVDVWLRTFGKVLNIEWDDQGRVSLQSFKRGAWEAELISSLQPRVKANQLGYEVLAAAIE